MKRAKISKRTAKKKEPQGSLDFAKIAAIGQMMSAMAAYHTGVPPPEVKVYVVKSDELPEELR